MRGSILCAALASIAPFAALGEPETAVPTSPTAQCEQSVTALASREGIDLDTPQSGASSTDPVNSDRLAQSGGVIRPPDTGSSEVVSPPATGDRMPTTPAVPAQPGSGAPPSQTEMGGATRLKLSALLTAAQAAAKRGDAAQCRSSLADATALASKAS